MLGWGGVINRLAAAASGILAAVCSAFLVYSLTHPGIHSDVTFIAAIATFIAATLSMLALAAARSHSHLQSALAQISAHAAELAAMQKNHANTLEELQAIATRANQAEQLLNTRASGEAVKNVTARVGKLEPLLANLSINLNAKASGEAVKYVTARVDKLEPWLARVSEDLNTRASAEAHLSVAAKVALLEQDAKSFHVHSRRLSKTDITALIEQWAKPLGATMTPAVIRYLAERIRTLELTCVGRLATDMQTILARTIAALSIPRREIRIAEIGVLFGVGAGAIYDACRFRFEKTHLTLIDPLQGYYDRSNADVITQVNITREALEYNLAAMAIPGRDVEIIQGMSESPETLARLKDAEFDLLIIDGDHSFDGVKRDFENYRSFVRDGGLILFDDYDTTDWPDIKKFVDSEVMTWKGAEMVAAGFRTALFRVTSGGV